MKHRKIVVLKVLDRVGESAYANSEVVDGADALHFKYNGRIMNGHAQQVHIAEAGMEEADVGLMRTIGITDAQRAAIVQFAGGNEIGLYIVAHGTRHHIGSVSGGVTGGELGTLVQSLGVHVVYVCVVACEAGKVTEGASNPVIELCNSYAEVVQKPTIAGYGTPVFTVNEGADRGRKQASVMGGGMVLARELRNWVKPEGARDKEQKREDKRMAQAKRQYKRVYVFDAGNWIDTRAAGEH